MPEPQPRLILAFDFGRRRIGLAAGDTLTGAASPRPAVRAADGSPDWDAIAREVQALRPHLLVVGLPYNEDGSAGVMAAAAREFARKLSARFGLPVEHVDERWSSLEAGAALKDRRADGRLRRRVRRTDIDSAAAAIILTRWLAGERTQG